MHADAMLCDAATSREGLLHILGGGISRVERPSFPALLGATVAIQLTLAGPELGKPHELRVNVRGSAGSTTDLLASIKADFSLTSADGSDDDITACIPVVLQGVGIPAAGRYHVEIVVDGEVLRTLRFVARVTTQPSSVPPHSSPH